MKNFVQKGEVIDYVNGTGSAIASGAVVVIGKLIGVAVTDIADTATGAVALEGVYKLAKNDNLVITQGDKVFWDTTEKEVTKTVTDKPLGIAMASEVLAATTVNVLLGETGGVTPVAAAVAALTENAGALGGTNNGDLPDLTATYVARTSAGGGTADGAYEDEGTLSTAGGNTYSDAAVNTVIAALKNNIKENATVIGQLAADNVALRAAIRENSAKQNAVIAVLKAAGLMAS